MTYSSEWHFDVPPKRAALLSVTLLTGYALWNLYKLARLTKPEVQREIIHERNAERVPELITHSVDPFEKIDDPIHHGMAPFAARNVWLYAKDGSKLHGWHTLPLSYYRKLRKENTTKSFPVEVYEKAIMERPTILFSHGTGWTVAAPRRVRAYSLIASRLDCNVLSIDYRGYGLSPGVPTETTCFEDARTAWDCLADILAEASPVNEPKEMIGVLGQSLGGCIASDLVLNLQKEGVSVRSLTINGSPTSVPDCLADSPYPLFASLRLKLRALGFQNYVFGTFAEQWALDARIQGITCPILLTHTIDDTLVTETHHEKLTSILREGRLGATSDVAGRFTVTRYPSTNGKGELITWRGPGGGHSDFVGTEVVVDMLGEIMHL